MRRRVLYARGGGHGGRAIRRPRLVAGDAALRALVRDRLADKPEGALLLPRPPVRTCDARVAPVRRRRVVVGVGDRCPAPPLRDITLELDGSTVSRVDETGERTRIRVVAECR